MQARDVIGGEIEERPGLVDGEPEHLAIGAVGEAGGQPEDLRQEPARRGDVPRQHSDVVNRDHPYPTLF